MRGCQECAQIAGRTAVSAIQLGKHDAETLSMYQNHWISLLRKEFLAMTWFRTFFNSLNDHEIDLLFKKLAKKSIISVIEEVGDMDLQARAISAGLTQIPFFKLFKLLPKAVISLYKSL